MSSEIFKGMSTQDLDTFGRVDFMVDESLPGSFCRVKGDHGTLSRRSQRLSRHSGSLADEAIRHCIASCSCTIYQPINVPVDEKWECYMDRQDPDARPLFPSKNYMVYLSFSKMDDSYHLTVIKHEKNQENKIFLTIPLQALTTGNLKYNIKRPSWHQVSVQENGRQKDFVIDLGNDPQGATFTEKVKDALDNLEHGGSVNSHHTGYAQVRNSQEVKNSMEEGLMPSGVNRALSARLAKTDHTEKLVDQLRAAILTGDAAHARQIAESLANERITLKIELDKEEHQRRLEESYLNVKVHVEDRETSGCDIKMKFKPSDTIRDLKNSMKLQYEFPVEVQRWIIGKKIPKDNETLHKCGIRGSGHTLYLYLTTARSVGLDQQQSMDTMPRGAVGGEGSGDYMTMGTLRESVRRPPELSHGLSRPPSRQMSTLSSSSGTTLSAVSENDQTSISPLRNSDFTPNLGQPQSRAKSQHRAQTNNPQEVQDNTVFATGQPIASSNLQGAAPVAQVSEETGEVGWVCPRCTFLNKPTRPGCEVCGGDRPPDYQAPIGYIMSKEELCWLADDEEQRQMLEEAERQNQQQLVERSKKNFSELLALDNRDLVPNTQAFDCPICFDNVPVGEGVVLRECLHTFCQDCLMNAVRTTEEASLKCPYQDDDYTCQAMLQDREVRALVSDDIYARYLQRSLDTAESQANNSYHCKTTDCHGWCIYEDLVNFFKCPVCNKENCLTCKAIHENMNCQQYQDDLKIRAANDHAAQQTQLMLNKLVSEGEAMPCPQCKVIVQKKDGCDWIKCSICKTEICWVTKGRRWGPNGEGDISGGCGCRVNGAKCDPRCNNCH